MKLLSSFLLASLFGGLFFTSFAVATVPVQALSMGGNTCTWVGAGSTAGSSLATNLNTIAAWTDCAGNVPQDGDSMDFPMAGNGQTIVLDNDLSATTFGQITGSSAVSLKTYLDIEGFPLTLTDASAITVDSLQLVLPEVTFTSSAVTLTANDSLGGTDTSEIRFSQDMTFGDTFTFVGASNGDGFYATMPLFGDITATGDGEILTTQGKIFLMGDGPYTQSGLTSITASGAHADLFMSHGFAGIVTMENNSGLVLWGSCNDTISLNELQVLTSSRVYTYCPATITNNLYMDPNTTFIYGAPITLDGTATINGTSFSLLNSGMPVEDHVIFNKTSGGQVSGTFLGYPQDGSFVDGEVDYEMSYEAGDGNNVVLVNQEVAPQVQDDQIVVYRNIPKEISFQELLSNDSDANDDDLTIISVTPPDNGDLTQEGSGNDTVLTYTPDLDFTGYDSFTYTVSDGIFESTATVQLNVAVLYDTTMTFTSSQNPSSVGQPVTLTATVQSTDIVPLGSVQFYDGETLLNTVSLTPVNAESATATLTITNLSIGTHTLTAIYVPDNSGDAVFPEQLGSVNPTGFVSSQATITQVITAALADTGTDVPQGFLFSLLALSTAGLIGIQTSRLLKVARIKR